MILRGPARPDLLRDETLYEILRETAARQPRGTALQFGGETVSYEQLLARATAVGGALSRHGAGPGGIVGLWIPRSASLLIAQAGITACGAAWLPLDADIPLERAATCLQSAQASGVVTLRSLAHRLSHLPLTVWTLEDLLASDPSPTNLSRPEPSDPAYVIYTSGSTGAPKGIAVSQSNICHFLRSENEILGIRSEDRVYQGFSAAFDMSFEEIWISYLVGATVWIAPAEIVADPEAISEAIKSEGITVLHAVPTLVSLIEDFPPHLRLLNIGGEACPNALAERLAGTGRRVFNSYGPTETTVTASIQELRSGKEVTIGQPLPNYGILVVSQECKPLPKGHVGEIAIFGPGVSLGYLNLEALTSSRFVTNPGARDPSEERLYLTGDLGSIGEDDCIRCLGRVDHQVKIRGFRIELDEVAAALAREPGVGAAAAVARPLYGSEEIVAYVVPSNTALRAESVRKQLAQKLPSYMVPAHVELLDQMPRLSSGKIDLAKLKTRPLLTSPSPRDADSTHFEPTEPSAVALWAALSKLFPGRTFSPDHDFFDDLGGHSLLAARLVSLLRKNPAYASAGVQHVYKNKRLGEIAEALSALEQNTGNSTERHHPAPLARRFACGVAQLLCLPFIVLLDLLIWLAPFFTYHALTGNKTDSIPLALLTSVLVFLLTTFLSFPLSVFLRRLLAGSLHPGEYPLWGLTYFRWWLGSQISKACAVHLISGTPWKAVHLRMLGARVGRNTTLNSLTVAVPELLEIGDGVCVGTFVNIENARVEGGRFLIGRAKIGDGACVDSYAVLENDTALGKRARLCGQSTLARGRSIPDAQTWSGAPAEPVAQAAEHWTPPPEQSAISQLADRIYFAVGGSLIAVLFFVPTFPAFVLIDWIDANTIDLFDSTLTWWQAFPFFFAMALPAAMVLVLLTALLAGCLRSVLPQPKPGRFPLNGGIYRSKWMLSTILDASLQVLHGLYASVFASSWLRLLGAKVGRDAEISTAEGVIPNLLQLGEGSFIADGALLGDEEQRDGWMHLQGTVIGRRTFIGNGAYVPDGAAFPDDVLLGVQSSAPANNLLAPGQTWMGSPPMQLPARETISTPDPALTFHPARWRRLMRGTIEAFRIVLPMAFLIAAGYVIVYRVMDFAEDGEWSSFFAAALLSGLIYSCSSFLAVLALKWLLVGRYRSRKAPMWTAFVWLSEAVTVAYESLAVPAFLDHLRGTPFLPWAMRLLGANIGRGVWMNTTDLTEFDCVHIGSYAELNAHSGPQTHLFEDRVMRIGEVRIGTGATVGVRSTVLYDAVVGDFCRLGPLTLVAKGEQLPDCSAWEGTPSAPSKTGTRKP
jgi:non-ribosomal peptide synthetase-like protein